MSRERTSDSAKEIARSTRRRVVFGANTALGLALAAALVVMINYLAARHYHRVDISRVQFYGLSDKTRALLQSLTSRVDIVVFFQPDHPSHDDVLNLLKEYEYASPHVRVERVDPHRDVGRAEALARQYDLTDINVVIFAVGTRSKIVGAEDLVEYDYSRAIFGEPPRAVTFRGEQLFSSALHSLTQERPPVVYFLRGHGERDINDRNPYTGFSAAAQHLRRDNMEVRDLLLGETRQIPADADALVIAGPTKDYSPAELDVLRAWLDNGGRLLVLLDTGPTAGLLPLLEDWGLRLPNEAVIDPLRSLTGLDLFITDFTAHPVVRNLSGVTCVFYFPRPIEPAADSASEPPPADRPRVTVLARSSSDSWAESDLEQRPIRFNSGRDRRGPISIAAAVERGASPELDVNVRQSRLVVIGDTDFVSNGGMSGGNPDLFLNAVNWLVEREGLLAISAKPVIDLKLVISREQMSRVFWYVVVIMPGLVALLGAGVWWQRRS